MTAQMTSPLAYFRQVPVPKMPTGLVQLMEEMTKEVLRHNPPDVYEFCAQHFQKLLIIRDGEAPKKQKLTLEQKIKRAQDKVRERVERRRQNYDKEMKKVAEVDPSPNVTQEAAPDPVTNEGDLESAVPKDVKELATNVMECKLKAPVHHEKELTDALEMEIFHKPVEKDELKPSLEEVMETSNEDKHHASNENEDILKDAPKDEESSIERNLSAGKNKKFKGECNDQYQSDEKVEHVRIRRNINTEKEGKEMHPIVGEKNDQNETLMSLVESDEMISKVNQDFIEKKFNETSFKNLSENKEDEVESLENTIDNALLFANELLERVPTSESAQVEILNDLDKVVKPNSHIDNHVENIMEANDTNKDATLIQDNYQNQEQTNNSELMLETEQNNIDDMSISNGSALNNEKHLSENIDEIRVENDKRDMVEAPGKQKTILTDNGSINDICPEHTVSIETVNEQAIDDLKQKANTETVDEGEKEKAEETDESENSERPNKNENFNNGRLTPNKTKISDDEKVHLSREGEPSEALTTVDKVLVFESISIKDDNDSAPLEEIEHLNTDNNESQDHVSRNVDHSDANGHETPEREAMLVTEHYIETSNEINDSQDLLKVHDEILENGTKTESSSITKSSSMNDSTIKETINNVVEITADTSNPDAVLPTEHQSSMDLETAAVTIQKVFRSFMFKRSTFDDTGIEENNSMDDCDDGEKLQVDFPGVTQLNKERRTLGISRMDTVLQTVNEEKSLSLSTDDSSLSSAATILQAHVRGFLVRSRLNSNKTISTSLGKSEGPSTSFDADHEPKANKTVLNIHIVPEGEHFLRRDESLLTSMELSLDGSPPSPTNLHPLGYDKSERRQLKREDAIQSISPPSNNSGKLSEDVDSLKDMIVSDDQQKINDSLMTEPNLDVDVESRDDTPTKSTTIETVIEAHHIGKELSIGSEQEKHESFVSERRKRSLVKANSDESDVVCEDKSYTDSDNTLGLLHSGEFHDILLPTKVSRADTTVVRGE